MDIIASAGFGLDVDSQKNPENKFTKYAKMLFDFKFSRLIILISKSHLTNLNNQTYVMKKPTRQLFSNVTLFLILRLLTPKIYNFSSGYLLFDSSKRKNPDTRWGKSHNNKNNITGAILSNTTHTKRWQ